MAQVLNSSWLTIVTTLALCMPGTASSKTLTVVAPTGGTFDQGAPFVLYPPTRDSLAGIIYTEGASLRSQTQTQQTNPSGEVGSAEDLAKSYTMMALAVLCRDFLGKKGTGTGTPTALHDCVGLGGMEQTKCNESYSAADAAVDAWDHMQPADRAGYCETRDHFYNECWTDDGKTKTFTHEPSTGSWADQLRNSPGDFSCLPVETRGAGAAFGDERGTYCHYCFPLIHVR